MQDYGPDAISILTHFYFNVSYFCQEIKGYSRTTYELIMKCTSCPGIES